MNFHKTVQRLCCNGNSCIKKTSLEPCGKAHRPGSHYRNCFQLPARKTPLTAYLRDPVPPLPWLTSRTPQSERGQGQSTTQRHDAPQDAGA